MRHVWFGADASPAELVCRCDGVAVGTDMLCNDMEDCSEFLLASRDERDGKCARVEGSNTPQSTPICPPRPWPATTPEWQLRERVTLDG